MAESLSQFCGLQTEVFMAQCEYSVEADWKVTLVIKSVHKIPL